MECIFSFSHYSIIYTIVMKLRNIVEYSLMKVTGTVPLHSLSIVFTTTDIFYIHWIYFIKCIKSTLSPSLLEKSNKNPFSHPYLRPLIIAVLTRLEN